MKKDEPMRNINPFGLRLQPSLKAKLEEAAASNKRSLNAEITARLEDTLLIEEAIQTIAPGMPLSETGQLITDLNEEREAAATELQELAMAAQTKKLNEYFSYSEARLDKIESRIDYMIDQFRLAQGKK